MMHFSIYKVILIGLALFFIADRSIRFARKEKSQSLFKLGGTIIIWGTVILVALFPQYMRDTFGQGENFNFLIFITFIVLFIIIFKLLNSIETIEKNLTEIVRKEALKKLLTK